MPYFLVYALYDGENRAAILAGDGFVAFLRGRQGGPAIGALCVDRLGLQLLGFVEGQFRPVEKVSFQIQFVDRGT